jgi:hypothetical protein
MTARKVKMTLQITSTQSLLYDLKKIYRKGIFWQSNRKEAVCLL